MKNENAVVKATDTETKQIEDRTEQPVATTRRPLRVQVAVRAGAAWSGGGSY